MDFETVSTTTQPILFVTRTTGMDSDEIGGVMEEAFRAIGSFFERNGISPFGPPMALYHDWDGKRMEVDVGFPVGSETAVSDDEVKSGHMPEGQALKALHRGSYINLRQTYEAMEEFIKQKGLKTKDIAWEVYVNDPDNTPEEDLQTEIYMPLA
jgi:effector-binding domain-containing protein